MQPRTQCTVPLCQICCLQSLRRILCAPIHSKRSTDHLMPSIRELVSASTKWQDASSCFMALLFANGIRYLPSRTGLYSLDDGCHDTLDSSLRSEWHGGSQAKVFVRRNDGIAGLVRRYDEGCARVFPGLRAAVAEPLVEPVVGLAPAPLVAAVELVHVEPVGHAGHVVCAPDGGGGLPAGLDREAVVRHA